MIDYSLNVNTTNHGGGDFRVKSVNNDYMLFSDANQDNISIGASSSPSTLGVNGDITATHLTASGNISSSAGLIANTLQIDGSQVDFTGLPTSDPVVAGRLWNDSNTLKISTG